MPDPIKVIEELNQKYAPIYSDIRNDTTHVPEWRRQQIAKTYLQVRAEADKAVDVDRQATTSRVRLAEARVYGIGSLAGDQGSLMISARDAADRVASIHDEHEAAALLARADRSGDETLARALVQHAIANRWVDVVNAFLETRPTLQDPVELLWHSTESSSGQMHNDFVLNWAVSGLIPGELVGLSPSAIQALATGPLPTR